MFKFFRRTPPKAAPVLVPEQYALTAMVIWELHLDPLNLPDYSRSVFLQGMANLRDKHGAAETRQHVLDVIAPAAEDLWQAMRDADEFDDSFDWEFCPRYVEHCWDFENGCPKPNARQILLKLFEIERKRRGQS